MCGFAGCIDFTRATARAELCAVAGRMADTLAHRGPDASGRWADEQQGVALAHRRLAIIDLSPAGAQPMRSADGRYTVAFNGEIYNFQDLRRRLQRRYPFRGRSDTEVLLAAICEWGLDEALARANGMFAFALWDAGEKLLHLVRDRVGEKPLYYAVFGSTLLFGSELRALRAHPAFVATIDHGALTLFFRHSYVPGPYSIFEGVRKLPPGAVLTIAAGCPATQELRPRPYWSYSEVARAGLAQLDGDDAIDGVEQLLRDAVGLRMQADVPLGAFLSGGLDSSLIVALMQAQSSRPVRTFTVGLESASHDEAPQARQVANHLGTEHTEVTVTAADGLEAVPRLASVYDEPFADPSQLPTLLIADVARGHVTVALSGDGGDEVFGGYNRYVYGSLAWHRLRSVPVAMRALGARSLLALSPAAWDALGRSVGAALPGMAVPRNVGDKLHKLAPVMAARDVDEVYQTLASTWRSPAMLVRHGWEPPTPLSQGAANGVSDAISRMMLLDGVSTLPDDMLTKVDRASMAVSLEVRVPLLDHRVVELAWRLPPRRKVAGRQGKAILRDILHRYVPAELVDRPKMGFDPPVATWLRGPLRAWAEDLLDRRAIAAEGLLDPAVVRRTWTEHLTGKRNHDYELWSVLMFRSWMATWSTATACPR